jgi:hypothetical protein
VCRIEQRSPISLLIQRKNSQGLTIAVESPPFGRADREITAKAMADLGCVHCRLQQIEFMHNNLSPGSNENYWGVYHAITAILGWAAYPHSWGSR